jgi:hypothetical protein
MRLDADALELFSSIHTYAFAEQSLLPICVSKDSELQDHDESCGLDAEALEPSSSMHAYAFCTKVLLPICV